jgi:ketosteroid isomerase-like protein
MTIHDPERTGETFHGTEGFTAFSEEWLEQWEDYRIDIDEIHDAGDGAVVVLGTQSGRGKGSGIELSDAINLVFRIDEGKVAEYTIYTRREDALAAADLSGERSNG